MILDDDVCFEALRSHDSRFDGAFFVGVASTGIYCRTVCTARPPLRRNCTFYISAAAAERAGYRPCLRCRPELAPGKAPVDATSSLGAAIAARIESGCLSDTSISDLAAEMGVSERHLRRVVQSEFGVSPIELAQTQRLHIAKRLLTDTNLPITQIAFASGFASVRRFNALFKVRYRLNPTDLRRHRSESPEAATLRCALAYRPPMDWNGILRFLEQRAIPGVECVRGGVYHRTIGIGQHRGWISVSHNEARRCLNVDISHSLLPAILPVLTRTKHLFDLCADPIRITDQLGELASGNPGARVPGAFDGFEMAVRAICGQQITVRGATTLAGRIATIMGESLAECPIDGLTRCWPTAHTVALQSRDVLIGCGFIGRRADTILALANEVAAGCLRLEPGADVERTMALMTRICGIGEWTAQYVAMRALRWPDAFPHSDLGILKALGTTDARASLTRAEAWRPWRAYAAIHLWRTLEKTD
jgi:AraC family transcriptional regulator of adaptative response / DNA-3-methyladenine glycosylase II